LAVLPRIRKEKIMGLMTMNNKRTNNDDDDDDDNNNNNNNNNNNFKTYLESFADLWPTLMGFSIYI
jgi:hypothetical protein